MQSPAYQDHKRWLRIRGLSPGTIAHREQSLAALARYFGGKPLAEVTEQDLLDWTDSLAGHDARSMRAGSRDEGTS